MIKIEVTADDIANGKRGDSTCCPIALACLRIIHKDWFEVFQEYLNIEEPVPTVIKEFILAFDRKKDVQPFTFELPDSVKTV
jgi:hypothetical protein